MPLLLCPNCNQSMTAVNRQGVEFDMCPTCRGVWLDRGELEKLVAGSVIRCGKVTICDATFVDRAELQWIISSTDNSIPVQDTVRYPY